MMGCGLPDNRKSNVGLQREGQKVKPVPVAPVQVKTAPSAPAIPTVAPVGIAQAAAEPETVKWVRGQEFRKTAKPAPSVAPESGRLN